MSKNIFYVYTYLRKDGTPYYIGKGHKGRFDRIDQTHENVKLPPKDRRVKLRENLTEQEAYDYEAELIQEYGRKNLDKNGILWNASVGGRGSCTKYYTEEDRVEGRKKMNRERYKRKHIEIRAYNNEYRSKPEQREKQKKYKQDKRKDPKWVDEYNKRQRERREKNKDKINARVRELRKGKEEERNTRERELYHANKDKINARRRELYTIKRSNLEKV